MRKQIPLFNRNALQILFIALISIIAFTALILPQATRPSSYSLTIGEVANQDIQAPSDITYVSEILTEKTRKEAENSVAPVFLPPDPSITRNQIERLRLSLNYIDIVRADKFAASDQKINDLKAMADVQLAEGVSEKIILMPDTRWQIIKVEALQVLEQVMRSSIREYQLRDVTRNIPSLISFALTKEQASIVTELVSPFVIPNSLFSDEQTQTLKNEARVSIQPVVRNFVTGQTLVDRGQIITEAQIESLEQYGLIQNQFDARKVIASGMLVVILATILLAVVNRHNFPVIHNWRAIITIGILFILFLLGARYIIPNRAVIPYLYPIPAFALIISSLFGIEISIILSFILSILAAYDLPISMELSLYYFLTSVLGAVVLGRGRRVSIFFWAGAIIGLTGGALLFSYRIASPFTDWIGIATLIGAALIYGFASSSIALILHEIIAQMLGITTALQLLEISRPDHPLLQFFLRNAPGSYQHSLQVANLAEQAARAIGADTLLVRSGAIYHDVGKSINSSYFIENQVTGSVNPHDELDPHTSAKWIISHVREGVELAKKYRLPPRIRDFILEHHGTMYTRYQYAKALDAVGGNGDEVNIEDFRYPGPKPQSRETALLMLADGCEAIVRVELPHNEGELRELIQKVFDFYLKEGQLDYTEFTLRDLTIAAEAFVRTLINTHHLRIKYPEIKVLPKAAKNIETSPTIPLPEKSKF